MKELKLLFLGTPRIELGGKAVIQRRSKVLALLAYLAVTGRSHSRDELAELLYPDLERERASAGLRQSLFYLRQSLGDRWIEIGPRTASLPPAADLMVDVVQFRRILDQARLTAGRTSGDGGVQLLARAARLYRGPFLASFYLKDSPAFEQWQADQEQALRQEEAGVLGRLIEAHRRRGELEAAVEWAQAAVELDPLEEGAHRRVMSLLAASGRRQQALQQYERCRSVLSESLGAKPDADTEALRAQIADGRLRAEQRPAPRREPAPADGGPTAARALSGSAMLLAGTGVAGRDAEVRTAFPTVSAAMKQALRLALPRRATGRGSRRGTSARPALAVAIHAAMQSDSVQRAPNESLSVSPWERASSLLRAARPGQILVSDAAARLAAADLPPGASLRPLGTHQLDDLGPPMAIWRLAHRTIASRLSGPRTLDTHPGNLRSLPGMLIGREREIDAVVSLVREGEATILTLTGPGGTGKTRLALHAAGRVALSFPDGAFFIDLAAAREPGHVVPAIGAAVGLRQSPGDARPLPELLLDFLSRREVLLVLDNFEHLLPAAPSVGEIASACPGVRMIVTSREPLHLLGEKEFPVPALSLGQPGAPLANGEAVRLLAERARDAVAGLAVTEATAPVLADICARLDCLPLAIELAAPWLKVLPAPVLLERLDHRLELLSRGSRDLPERQRTLRGEIAWSYDLLGGDEQRVFRLAAVFTGSFALDAAEAVAPGRETLALLASLLGKNLLRQESTDGAPRFRMLETIREFAAEQLGASGEARDVESRFAAWALGAAERACGHFLGPEQAEWLSRLETEDANLQRALALMLERRQASDGMRLSAALGWFWFRSGRFAYGAQWLEGFLGMRDETVPAAVRARANYHLGWMRLMLGGTFSGNVEAGACFRAGLEAAVQSGDRTLQALCQEWLAWCEADVPMAERFAMADRGVAIAREARDPWALSFCLKLAHSQAARTDEKPADRMAALEEAIRLAQETGDPFLVCQALHGMGDVHLHLRDDEAAEPWYLASLERAEEIGDAWSAFDARSHLAWGWLNRGDTTRAARSFAEALQAAADIGARAYVAQFLHGLATIAKREGRMVRALRLGGAASAIRYRGRPRWDQRLTEETGLPPAAVQKEWSAGGAMSVDEAVRCALENGGSGAATSEA